MISLGRYQTTAADSVGKLATTDCDGPASINNNFTGVGSIGFPSAVMIANTWNEKLALAFGQSIGKMADEMNVSGWYAPAMNIHRSAFAGRNFEYYSEDGFLSGKMAANAVAGAAESGVYAYVKHFALNDQETNRWEMITTWANEQSIREIYLKPFEIAVKEADTTAVMSSYNFIGTQWAGACDSLLNTVLREEWGFEGFVVTDWGASNNHVRGVAAGSNLEMPNPGFDSAREVLQAIEEKTLTMEELDACVDRLLNVVLSLTGEKKTKMFSETAHHELARKAAAESAVLLKNNEKILPLPPKSKVALIGDFAVEPRGSSMVNPTFVESLDKVIENYDLQLVGINRGYIRTGGLDAAMRKEALKLARAADVVLYCFGLDELSESEGLDRTHMRIPQNQIELLEALAQVNPHIVGIISAGAAIEMPWQISCQAILHGYLTGQAGASAMLDLITGKASPGGRLAETYPVRHEDTPAYRNFPASERNAEYREAIYIGYRYYDTSKVRVQYPFGFGLSYTEFVYSDIEVDECGVSFTLTNTGDRDGAEVAQLYVGLPNAIVFRPEKELKGFTKVFLKAGGSRRVRIPFDDKTFRYWNVKTDKWEVEMGNYQVMVGASVADIRLTAQWEVEGTTTKYPYNPAVMQYYYTGIVQQITDEEFGHLLGHPIPSGKWSGELGANDAICQMYYAKSGLARFIYNRLNAMKKKSEVKGKPDLNILFIYNMPFRALAKMTGGIVSMEMVEGILDVVNGHFLKGMGTIVGGFFRNRKVNRRFEKKLTLK